MNTNQNYSKNAENIQGPMINRINVMDSKQSIFQNLENIKFRNADV